MFEQEICEMIEAFEKMLIMQRQTLSETETTPWNTKRFQILNELNWICYKNKIQNLVYGNIVKIVQGNEKKNVWQFHLNFKIIYRSNVTPNTEHQMQYIRRNANFVKRILLKKTNRDTLISNEKERCPMQAEEGVSMCVMREPRSILFT